MLAQRGEHRGEHELAVDARVLLRPLDRLDVVVEELGALAQIGEVAVGQVDLLALHLAPRELDEVRADPVAGAAAAAVEHHPDAVLLVEADLDEVVAAAERAELLVRAARARPAGGASTMRA